MQKILPDRYLATMDIDYNVYLTTSENAVDYRTEIGDLQHFTVVHIRSDFLFVRS